MRPLLPPALLLLALGGCASAPPPYLAKVNGEPVTAADLKEQFVKRHGGHEKFLAGPAEVKKFVGIVVDVKLLVQEAYRLGLDELPAVRADVEAYRDRKMLEHFLKTEIDGKAAPSYDDVRAAWERHTNEVVAVRQVVVETREEAEEIRRALEGGTPMERLARACSVDASRVHDGLLPEVPWGSMDAEWDEVVLPLAPGTLSPVFRTAAGYTVARMESRIPVERPDFTKARPKIEAALRRRNVEARRAALTRELTEKYRVVPAASARPAAEVASLRTSDPKTPAVTWDGGALTVKELLSPEEAAMLRRLPPVRARAVLEELLRRSLNEALALREAKERRLDAVPEVAEQVKRRRETLMEGALYADHVLKGITVTDEEVAAFYEKNRATLVKPERRRVSHILVETEAEAADVRAKLDAGEPFPALVKARSKDAGSVKQAGDLGFITKKDVPPEFASVLSLGVGEVSKPLPSRFGWHLVRVAAVEPERPVPFEEAKADLEKRVREEKQRERRAFWVGKLREAAEIEVSDAAIAAFVKQENAEP